MSPGSGGRSGLSYRGDDACGHPKRRQNEDRGGECLDALDTPADERAAILQLARLPLPAGDPGPPPDTDDDAAPLHAPHGLPAAPTPLVGRYAELQQLRERLGDPACRVVTLVGPGGIGKTRLALAAATELGPAFRDGAVWVEVAPLQDASALAATVARAIGCPSGGAGPIEERLHAALRERNLLLVLDNLEQLPEAAPLLAAIVRQAPRVTLLLTSRQRLRLPGEWVLPLEGLPLPAAHAMTDAESDGAARLFLERMRQAGAVGDLGGAQREALARICRLVEGVPLAIELAAAWTRTLSCVEIAAELARSPALLAEPLPSRGRHGSMRAVFDQSWALLGEADRRTLAALAVLQGSFTREAAEHVAGASLPTLASLIEQSLLRRHDDRGQSRYTMHALVRQYAAGRRDRCQPRPADRGGRAPRRRRHTAGDDRCVRLARAAAAAARALRRGGRGP